jgi:tetratricopeptide (TPR) repeat protein
MMRMILSRVVLLVVLVVLGGLAACGRGEPPPEDAQPMGPIVERLLRLGTEALQQHAFVQAFAFADSAAVRAPDLADIPFLRGRIYAELARLDEAEAAYRQALTIRPDYPGGWHNLGNTAYRQQKYSEAIQYYHHELTAHPDPRPWRGIGQAYVELGKPDSARYAFERALSIDSTFAEAHFSRALLLEDLGEYDGALQATRRALAHDPESPEYRYYAGSYLVQLGRPAEALAMLQPVVEQWPWHQGAHYNVAQALMRLGRTEDARVFQERAEELRELQAQISHHENTARVQPTDPYAHAGLGTLLRRAGRYNDAMHAYQVALYLDPSNLEFRNNVAVLHLLRHDTTAAIQAFAQIVRADTTNAPAWINLGSLYAMSGEPEKARTAWRTALRFDPANEIARRSLERLSPPGENP